MGNMLLGLVIGLSIGIAIGRRQKPFSELTAKEKKITIGIMVGLGVLVVLGIVTFFLAK